MHLSITEALPLPPDDVFHLLRDDMPALVPYLYDIDRIDVVGRVDQGEIVHIENLWHASMTHVPKPARPFVSPELLSWCDHATWTTSTRTSVWRLEPRVGSGIFYCTGLTTITLEGQGSRLTLQVDLD
ncbi:MAG: hypothetical protein GXP62_02070, partial [Oligoflexia bacterium]|nr:hypothetical protein [Oligoflexia bacterium]